MGGADVVELADVGVVDGRYRAGLAFKPFGKFLVGGFEDDFPVERDRERCRFLPCRLRRVGRGFRKGRAGVRRRGASGVRLSQGCYNPGMADANDWQGHGRIDARSLAMHRAIAAKLRASPELFSIATDNLRRWGSTAGRSQPYLKAWAEILTRPAEEVLSKIQEDNESMRAMRQTSPFAGVLSPKERWAIYDAYAVGTYHSSGGNDRR